jgi:RNA-directed DNA polymerase
MKGQKLEKTEDGTPQGGIISPTLCNITLNGLEKEVAQHFPNFRGISAGVHLIRYADDVVVTGKNEAILKKAKTVIEEFIKPRGLELNQKKTRIVNIREGIDFLGFNIRRRIFNPRLNKSTGQETVLIVKPSKKGIDKLKTKIIELTVKDRPMERIITDLNPVLRG